MRNAGFSVRWWWWDLPLRRKGWVVVGAPLLVLVATVLAALLLNHQQQRVREDARDARAVQVLSADVQRGLLQFESAVLAAAGGDPGALDTVAPIGEQVDDDLRALVDADAGVGDLSRVAVAAADEHLARLLALREQIETDAAVPIDVATIATTADPVGVRFAALDEAVASDSDRGRERIDQLGQLMVGLLVGGIVLAAVAAILMTRLFANSIVKRIAVVNDVTTKVLDGDFQLELESTGRDELGVLFEKLRQAGELLIDMNSHLAGLAAGERERLARERQLRDVLRTVHGEVGRESILDAAARELAAALDADRSLVMAVEDGQMGAVMAEWVTDGLFPIGLGRRLPTDADRDAAIAQGIAERKAVVIDDVATSEMLLPQTRDVLGQLGVGSLLVAPVVADDEPLGVLVLLTSGRSRPWHDDADRLLRVVAAEVATALAHARLLEREQEMVERLRELDQTRADFVASVSHELRTPLTSIRGYVEMLEDGDGGPLTDPQRHLLTVVQRNTDRLLALIEDLLTLSRIEAGSFRVVLKPTDLGSLVERTVEELRPQAAGHGVTLVAVVDPDVPPVLGEAQQLERILLNLLSNAVKFTPDGGDVEVGLARQGDEAVLSVADHGIGIPVAEQPRLFGRFFRSSTAQERAIQGTGLGLVIVKSIVDHHNGQIDVRSAPETGTTFTVRIPIATTSAAAPVPVGVT